MKAPRQSMRNMPRGYKISFCLCLLSLVIVGVNSTPATAQNAVVLVGSGSSVPAPLYNRWTLEYGKRNSNLQMRYLPVGTSEGIKQISHSAGDFGAGEAQLTEKERKEGDLIELPIVLIGIVPIYNIPDVHQELKLSGEVLAGIFLGEIKTWNAPQIAKLNPDVPLPSLPILVINRPAGKGSNSRRQGLELCFHRISFQDECQVPGADWSLSFTQVASRRAGGTQRRHGGKGEKHFRLDWLRRISICREGQHCACICTKRLGQICTSFL